MRDGVRLIGWQYAGDKVELTYSDKAVVFVSKTDFDRAFGAIISTSKEDVVNDFGIEA